MCQEFLYIAMPPAFEVDSQSVAYLQITDLEIYNRLSVLRLQVIAALLYDCTLSYIYS